MTQNGAGGVLGPAMVKATVRPSAQSEFDDIWGSVFGDVGQADEAAAGKPPAAHPESPVAPAPRSVLFTAAGRKEGVSTLIAGAALTGANINFNRRVGLLDLNLRYPQLAGIVGARPAPGLIDALAGRASLDDIAQTVGAANLTLYPSGLASAGGSGLSLLAGAALGELVRRIAARHDYLLADCPAANLFPDAQILAPLFDGVVLVAEAGTTRRESLAEAKKRIELGRGRLLGVVLNKRRYPVPKFLYRRS